MYGSYLLAIYNPEEEAFETISKIGTGFRWGRVDGWAGWQEWHRLSCARGDGVGRSAFAFAMPALAATLCNAVPAPVPVRAAAAPRLSPPPNTSHACHAPPAPRSEELLKQLADSMKDSVIPQPKPYYRCVFDPFLGVKQGRGGGVGF